MENKIQLFEKQQVRTAWDEFNEKWQFSVLDIIAELTDQPDNQKVRNYWKQLKNKLNAEDSQVVSITNQLKLVTPDGKMRLTDVVDTKQVFRIIHSIPSKIAEPFNMWLAQIAKKKWVFMVISLHSDPLISLQTDPVYTGITDPLYTGITDPLYTGITDPLYTGITDPLYTGITDPLYTRITDPVYTGITDPLYTGITDPVSNGIIN